MLTESTPCIFFFRFLLFRINNYKTPSTFCGEERGGGNLCGWGKGSGWDWELAHDFVDLVYELQPAISWFYRKQVHHAIGRIGKCLGLKLYGYKYKPNVNSEACGSCDGTYRSMLISSVYSQ